MPGKLPDRRVNNGKLPVEDCAEESITAEREAKRFHAFLLKEARCTAGIRSTGIAVETGDVS